jgi:hypothetical protein
MENKAEVLLWRSCGKHLGGLLGQTLCQNKLQNTEYSAAVLAYKIAFLSSSMQSACAVSYCHLWSVRLYHNFPNYLIIGTIVGKKLLKIKYFF